MYGLSGALAILAGLATLALSIFWPDNTFLAILLLTYGALICAWQGAITADTTSASFWTGMGIVTAAFVAPFYPVFGAPASPVLMALVGGVVLGLTVQAERYAFGKEAATMPRARISWPLQAVVVVAGTLVALLIRWLQP